METEGVEQQIFLQPEMAIVGAVYSVNGYTGHVVLTTSDLENTSDYQTSTDVAALISAHNTSEEAHPYIQALISAKQDPIVAGNGISITGGKTVAIDTTVVATQQNLATEVTNRENADIALQGQIDAISASSDVVDIVGTYADLQNYDTSKLKDNDIIKVLQDSTQGNATTYYRWSTTTQTFTLIGQEGPYYTKAAADAQFVPQTRTINSKPLSANITLTASDVSALGQSDIVQTTGTSTSQVMSQNAVTTALATKLDSADVPAGFFDGPATTSPTPATSLEIENAIKVKSVELQGDTQQQTYTGKNLFDISKVLTNGTNLVNNDDGSITASLATGSVGSSPNTLGTYCPSLQVGDTVSLSFTTTGSINYVYLGSPASQAWVKNANKTITQDMLNAPVYWYGGTGNTAITYSDIQVELGTSVTSYEPYTAGASPNPDYPQTVNVVTGRQVVNIKNQNLFDWQSLDHTNTNDVINATLNETLDNGVIVTGNVSSSTADFAASKGSYQPARNNSESGYRVHIPEGSTVSVSADITLLKTGYHASTRLHLDRAIGGGYGTTGEGTALVLGEKIRVSATFQNVEEGNYWPTFMLNSNYMKIENIQMELSDSPTQYGEYGNANYEINLGKNLFTFGSGSGKFQGVTWTRNGDTAVGVGTATGSYTDTGTRIDLPAPLKAGQDYVFSIPAPASFGCSLYLFDKNDQVVSPSAKINAGETSVVFNKDVDIYKARITLSDYGGAGKELNIELRAQIELGSTATGYAPHFEPIELCKIGDYQDYIYQGSDGWYVHKATGKRDVTSISSIYSSAGSGYIGAQFDVTDMAPNSRMNGYCNILIPMNSPSGATTEGITFGAGNKYVYVILKDSRMASSTVANWNAWLSSNTTTIYYPLATATDTKITDSTLAGQLDALLSAQMYPEYTAISANGDLPAILGITAYNSNLNGIIEVLASTASTLGNVNSALNVINNGGN